MSDIDSKIVAVSLITEAFGYVKNDGIISISNERRVQKEIFRELPKTLKSSFRISELLIDNFVEVLGDTLFFGDSDFSRQRKFALRQFEIFEGLLYDVLEDEESDGYYSDEQFELYHGSKSGLGSTLRILGVPSKGIRNFLEVVDILVVGYV